ncbi:MAG: hypothetical protein B7Z80_09490 [Rhodospirillales bacterium 20-64-7]|nr:MAG: hypothetical protein B7Z80_09490 [Rhodospirillales bacterium 20-64-7]
MGTATWNAGNGDWSVNADWTPNGAPGGAGGYVDALISNGATVSVATGETFNSISAVTVSASNLNIYGKLTGISSGNVIVQNGGIINVELGGTLGADQGITVDAASTLNVYGNLSTNAGITVNGTLLIASTATVQDGSGLALGPNATANVYGNLILGSTGLTGSGTITVNGGSLGSTASPLNAAGTNNIIIANGGSVYSNNQNPPGTITFGSGNGNKLVLTNYISTMTTPIYGFAPGDTIQFDNGANAGTGGTTLTSNGNGTYTVNVTGSNVVLSNVTLAPGVTPLQVSAQAGTGGYDIGGCFLTGSLIGTPSGEVAVENLQVGDVVTALEAGQTVAKTVKWVGYRHVKAGELSGDDAHPVRIKAGAFAENTPARDLLITNEHCIVVAGQLTPVRLLVNGRSIIVDTSISTFTYYHVELEEHGILLAEGLAVESYLDSGNRSNFVNAEVAALHPQLGITVTPTNQAQPVLPLLVEPAGLQPVWEALNQRAVTMGLVKVSAEPVLTHDADIHIITAAGAMLNPTHQQDDKVVFTLPAGATGLLLASRTSRPCDVTAPYIDDRRELGLSVGEIAVHVGSSSTRITAHLSTPELAGWHAVEGPGYRWTNGLAALPIDELVNGKIASLEIQILRAGPYLAATARPDAIAA